MPAAASDLVDWLCAAPGMVRGAVQERAVVVEQAALAADTHRLRLHAPELARRIVPGQFFMLRFPDRADPLLGRPFALYDVWIDAAGSVQGFEFVYHVIGKATGLLSGVGPGDAVELWGPLGNGFPVLDADHLICVGGGIGYTPFLAAAREACGGWNYGAPPRRVPRPPRRITLCYGVRDRAHRADLTDFARIPGLEILIATDDGSEGRRGFVTELLAQTLDDSAPRAASTLPSGSAGRSSPRAAGPDLGRDPTAVYCCGPEPMMHAVARLCAERGVRCWLSLETPMACGFGACFSCVTKVRIPDPPGWDYRRTCVEGPIFEATCLALD